MLIEQLALPERLVEHVPAYLLKSLLPLKVTASLVNTGFPVGLVTVKATVSFVPLVTGP